MAKPLLYPEWAATDTTLPATGNTNKQRPKESLRNIGWDKGQVPTAEEWNWQFDNISDWVKWFDENNEASKTITLTGNTTGTASFNNEGGISISTTTDQAAHANSADQAAHANSADQAAKWTAPRTLSFTGFATGSANVDGSNNVNISLSSGSGFSSSKTQNGYAYRPDGLIEQWGWISGGEDTLINVTLPITYPNSILNVSCTARSPSIGGSGTTDLAAHGDIISNSTIVVAITSSSGAFPNTNGVFWRTIGY